MLGANGLHRILCVDQEGTSQCTLEKSDWKFFQAEKRAPIIQRLLDLSSCSASALYSLIISAKESIALAPCLSRAHQLYQAANLSPKYYNVKN